MYIYIYSQTYCYIQMYNAFYTKKKHLYNTFVCLKHKYVHIRKYCSFEVSGRQAV